MTTATQQISSNPSRDFANGILEETNGGLDLFELLHEIAEGGYGANSNDQITAVNILTDRGLGKCPKQSPATNPDPDPETEDTGDNDVEALHEAPAAESPRLVTQIDQSLHDSLGPPPDAHAEPDLSGAEGSIQATIQKHILTITNNGQTLRDILLEIAMACPEPVEGAKEDPNPCPENEPVLSKAKGGRRITAYHRIRALRTLIDRLAGTDLLPAHSAVCPDCRRKWSTDEGSSAHPQPDQATTQVEDMPSDEERWAKIEAQFNRMEEEGTLTRDPNAPKIDISRYRLPKDFDSTPFEKEEAAKFWAEIDLRIERQKAWPAIEERRRKKLEQIYPSHSEDDKPPDT